MRCNALSSFMLNGRAKPFLALTESRRLLSTTTVVPTMLIRLVYASRAVGSFHDDVPGILQWSRDFNPSLEVTGMLCCLDGVYMQYLEGEESVLEDLFASIRKDTRHSGV